MLPLFMFCSVCICFIISWISFGCRYSKHYFYSSYFVKPNDFHNNNNNIHDNYNDYNNVHVHDNHNDYNE